MTSEAQTIRIPGLSDEERRDLSGAMPSGTLRFEENPVRHPARGRKLSTIAAIAVVSEVALPVTLSRGEYMAPTQAGLTTPEGVWGVPAEALTRAVGTTRAEQLDRARPNT